MAQPDMGSNELTRRCHKCKYILTGLLENRCPECGAKFNPDDPATYWSGDRRLDWVRVKRVAARAVVSPWLIIPLMWADVIAARFVAGGLFSLCAPIALVFALGAFSVNLYRRRWIVALVIVFMSPIAVSLAHATIDYWRGVGTLRFVGLPGPESYNIDPMYRCGRTGGGCLVSGHEWATQGAYNLALKWLIEACGPMRGSYVGPYPSKAGCLSAMRSGKPVSLDRLVNDRVCLPDRSIQLDAGVGKGLLHNTVWEASGGSDDEEEWLIEQIGPIKATLCQECLVLRIPSAIHTDVDALPPAVIVVIDVATGRPFAYYAEGEYRHHLPPVRWRE